MNGPLALTLRSSPPLSSSTTVPERPDTVPPTVEVVAGPSAPTPTQLPASAVPSAMIPGAPPLKAASVALMTTVPFSANERVEPLALSVSWVPATRGPDT